MYFILFSRYSLFPFLGCWPIALDKCPGVYPIGVFEVVGCLLAKAALYVIQDDVQAAARPHKLCAGKIAGTEAAVYAVRSLFNYNDSDAILLVDATDAFNSLNCSVAMYKFSNYTHL